MWRLQVQRAGGDHFMEFLKIIAHKQLQDDNFELPEVFFIFFSSNFFVFLQFHAEMSKSQFNCIFCGKQMTRREENRIHIQQHCLERPVDALPAPCIYCGLKFPSKASLRVHLSRWCKDKWTSYRDITMIATSWQIYEHKNQTLRNSELIRVQSLLGVVS